jgi:aryl-phospho-beta-D-glucosidase BglC (GH1 family)
MDVVPLQNLINFLDGQGFNLVRIPVSTQLVLTNPPPVWNYNLIKQHNPDIPSSIKSLELLDLIIDKFAKAGILVLFDIVRGSKRKRKRERERERKIERRK